MEPLVKTVPLEVDVAYLAGFFDGEGHIRIQRQSKRGSHMLQISVVQAEMTPLPLFKATFGGTIRERMLKYKGGQRALFTWQASSKVAQVSLEAMRPYLRTKLDEANVALRFRESFRPQYGDRSKLPEELFNWRIEQMIALQQIRKKKRVDGFNQALTALTERQSCVAAR